MRKLLLIVISIFVSCSVSQALDFAKYGKCTKTTLSKEENLFFKSFIEYIDYGSVTNGQKVIKNMIELYKNNDNKRFSTQYIGVFEGHRCSGSIGSTTLKKLYPRVEKVWVTASEVVLLYQHLAKLDGAEASSLEQYTNLIKQKHPWALNVFKKKYSGLINYFYA